MCSERSLITIVLDSAILHFSSFLVGNAGFKSPALSVFDYIFYIFPVNTLLRYFFAASCSLYMVPTVVGVLSEY